MTSLSRFFVPLLLLGLAGWSCSGDKCSWTNSGGADPTPAPLSCTGNTRSLLDQVRATVEGQQIRLAVAWCGGCNGGSGMCFARGDARDLQIAVEGSWATLVDVQPSSPICSDLVAHLLPTSSVSAAFEGDIRITGAFHGADQCHAPVTCPIDDRFTLSQGNGGLVNVVWRQ